MEATEMTASLREGLHETFTVNKMGLPPSLTRCLCKTHTIENPNGIVRRAAATRTWRCAGRLRGSSRDRSRWRKIQGIKDLWILKAAVGRTENQAHVEEAKLAA